MRVAGRSGNVGRKKPLLRGGRGDRDVRLLVVQPTVFREEQFVATIRLFVDTSTETWLLQPCLPSCVFALALVCACFLEQTSHTPSLSRKLPLLDHLPKGTGPPPPPPISCASACHPPSLSVWSPTVRGWSGKGNRIRSRPVFPSHVSPSKSGRGLRVHTASSRGCSRRRRREQPT